MTQFRQAARAALLDLVLPLAAALAVGCGQEEHDMILPPGADLALSPASITAIPGDTVRIRMTDRSGRVVRPSVLGASNAAVRIDTGGLVTAVAPGSAVVTLTASSGGQTVTASVPVMVLGLTLAPATATLAVGGAVTLHPEFVGDPAAYGALRWTSSDTTVAVVGADGTVRGVGSGVARIGVLAAKDARLRAEAQVTSVCGCGWGSLTVQPSTVTLQVGATQRLQVNVTLAPGTPTSTSRGALFTSSDTTVATVSDSGVITARRNGTAVVTVAMAASPTVTQAVSVTVRDPNGGRLTIQSITTGDPPVSVDPRAVRGTIRVTMNVPNDLGTVRRAELWLAGRLAVGRDSVSLLAGSGVTPVTLDVDADARDPQTGARLFPLGDTTLEVRLRYTPAGAAGTPTQTAVVPLPVTLVAP